VQAANSSSLTESLELLLVASEPGSLPGSTLDAVGTVSLLSKTTSLASGAGESTHLAMLVDGVDDPVDTRVVTDLLMVGVDTDDFVVFHGRVLVDPVRVENTEIGVSASTLFFRNILEIALEFKVVDTLMLGLTEDHTTMVLSLTSSAADTGTDNNVSLLGLVTEAMGLIGTGGAVASQDVGSLAVFPSTDTHQESEGIRLLVTPELFHILVGTHLELLFDFCNDVDVKNMNGE